ncbi:MAG: hypothetical protein ACKVHD_09475 [Alphaproteobacteria bacterium]|jgi:hypothetical protein|tara:strand:- start:278 stop:454 length:177 start_codon:yes stop_codon:yes gene_type:complete
MARLLVLVIIVFLLVYGIFWIFGKALEKVPSKLILIILFTGFSLGVLSSAIFYYYWFF